MTIDHALTLARLKERRSLAMVRHVITAHAGDAAWLYVAQAIDARLRELEALLAREDPQLVRTCDAMATSVMGPEPEKDFPIQDSFSMELPRGARVH